MDTNVSTGLILTQNNPVKEVFRLTPEGDIKADWHALRDLYDKYVDGNREDYVIMGAAVWAARNKT